MTTRGSWDQKRIFTIDMPVRRRRRVYVAVTEAERNWDREGIEEGRIVIEETVPKDGA